MLKFASDLNSCFGPQNLEHFVQELIRSHRICIVLSTDLLDQGDSTIGLSYMCLIPNKCKIEVKTAILFELNALYTVKPLK